MEALGPGWQDSEYAVITTPNLATAKPIHASSYPEGSGPDEANDGSFQSSWYLDEGLTSGWLEVDLMKEQSFNVVSLVEPVGRSDDYQQSRIESYRFQRWDCANWVALVEGESPAATTIHRIPRVTAQGSASPSRAATILLTSRTSEFTTNRPDPCLRPLVPAEGVTQICF